MTEIVEETVTVAEIETPKKKKKKKSQAEKPLRGGIDPTPIVKAPEISHKRREEIQAGLDNLIWSLGENFTNWPDRDQRLAAIGLKVEEITEAMVATAIRHNREKIKQEWRNHNKDKDRKFPVVFEGHADIGSPELPSINLAPKKEGAEMSTATVEEAVKPLAVREETARTMFREMGFPESEWNGKRLLAKLKGIGKLIEESTPPPTDEKAQKLCNRLIKAVESGREIVMAEVVAVVEESASESAKPAKDKGKKGKGKKAAESATVKPTKGKKKDKSASAHEGNGKADKKSAGRLTFMDLAQKVLREEKKPLTPREIWKIAVAKGYDKKMEINGKTPDATLNAMVITNTRDNPNTPFYKIGERPAKFQLKELR